MEEECYKYLLSSNEIDFLLAWDLLPINSVGFNSEDFWVPVEAYIKPTFLSVTIINHKLNMNNSHLQALESNQKRERLGWIQPLKQGR